MESIKIKVSVTRTYEVTREEFESEQQNNDPFCAFTDKSATDFAIASLRNDIEDEPWICKTKIISIKF